MNKVLFGTMILAVVSTTACSGVYGVKSSPHGYVSMSITGDREGIAALYEGENAKLVHARMPETELTRSPYYNNRLHELTEKVKGFFGKLAPAPQETGYQGS